MMKSLVIFLGIIFFSFQSILSQVNQTNGNGKKEGRWEVKYPESKFFKYKGQFKNGIPYGTFYHYRKDGSLKIMINHKSDGVAYSKLYHPNSKLMAVGKYINRKKDSTWIFYNEQGNLVYSAEYKNDLLNGKKTIYYFSENKTNPPILEVKTYANNILSGDWIAYYKDGKIKSKGKYLDGNLDGLVLYYYPSGKVRLRALYKHAVENGIWRYFDKYGQEERIAYWENGKELLGEKLEKKLEELGIEN